MVSVSVQSPKDQLGWFERAHSQQECRKRVKDRKEKGADLKKSSTQEIPCLSLLRDKNGPVMDLENWASVLEAGA